MTVEWWPYDFCKPVSFFACSPQEFQNNIVLPAIAVNFIAGMSSKC